MNYDEALEAKVKDVVWYLSFRMMDNIEGEVLNYCDAPVSQKITKKSYVIPSKCEIISIKTENKMTFNVFPDCGNDILFSDFEDAKHAMDKFNFDWLRNQSNYLRNKRERLSKSLVQTDVNLDKLYAHFNTLNFVIEEA